MMKLKILSGSLVLLMGMFACEHQKMEDISAIVKIDPGWKGKIVAKVDQSYAGWDVEIGDADNDGRNEILATGCPDSRLYIFKSQADGWQSNLLAENLAQTVPGMGLAVKIVDLNNDGKNELILGTGQEKNETALFYILQTDGSKVTKKIFIRPECNKSAYTHNLAFYDLDNDGIREVISAYCGGGEIIQYDVDKNLTTIETRKLYQLSGSGEESLIADVDNDGKVEYITANGFRKEKARFEIFEFDANGVLLTPPKIIVEGFEGNTCFYVSLIVGDVDNDGKNELIAGWKREQAINKATLIGYRIQEKAVPVYTFAYEDADLDMGYFEKMMAVADVDNDGKNELAVSTRGDNLSENITSNHLGYVLLFSIDENGKIQKELIADFQQEKAESSWLAVGDADNDNKNEIILATGKGDRKKDGISYVILLEKKYDLIAQ